VLSANDELLISKAESFVDFHVWPLPTLFNPLGWLNNFLPEEREHALNLLNAFVYFSPSMVDALFVSAFQQISSLIVDRDDTHTVAVAAWQRFCDTVLIVNVEGEIPNPTDSGYAYSRRARQLLGIAEARVLSASGVLERVLSGDTGPIVFVDDFVGSGSQFVTSWYRGWTLADGQEHSFATLSGTVPNRFFYCPLVCTSIGLETIMLDCTDIVVAPAHTLSAQYNLLSPDCHLWPAHLRPTAADFVRSASTRAGIPEYGTSGWRGFHDLGLGLAIDDSVPDATLPIFYWDQGWTPLIRRR
jgi:hypothetical protein